MTGSPGLPLAHPIDRLRASHAPRDWFHAPRDWFHAPRAVANARWRQPRSWVRESSARHSGPTLDP